MRNKPSFSKMWSVAEQCSDGLRQIPLIELVGQRRVLIEHHKGVLAYSSEEVQVKVDFGKLSVKGCGLYLSQINSEQLVIHGHIELLQLSGGSR